jgi:hypothetical protein
MASLTVATRSMAYAFFSVRRSLLIHRTGWTSEFPEGARDRPHPAKHGNQGGRETGFEEIGDGTSSLVTDGTGEDGTYKPTLHDGKKKDGSDDQRTCT